MQTSVDLQDPFSYSFLPIVLVVAAAVILSVVLVAIKFIQRRLNGQMKPKEKVKVFKARHPEVIRKDYLARIDKIEHDYTSGKTDVRITHQELSACVRLFVHEMTGINVHTFSLNELKAHGIDKLSGLIEQFYAPEFDLRTDKETMDSIRDAREVVTSWT